MIKIKKSKQLVGLDIGSHSIKAVELKPKRGNRGFELSKIGYETLPHESIVEGVIMDSTVVIDTIHRLFERNNIKNNNVALSLSGSGVIIKKISLPYLTPEELEESILWEAKQHIAFPLDEVTIDYVILETPKVEEERKMDVLLVAVKKDKINSYRSVITQAGKNLEVIEVDAFALLNSLEINYDDYRNWRIALINIGSDLTTINVVEKGIPIFVREFAMGGNYLTQNIQKEFNLNYEEAEQLKRGMTVKEISYSDAKAVIDANLRDLKDEIDKTFAFLDSQKITKGKIEKIFLSGGTAKLTGIVDYFRDGFKVDVEVLNPFRNIDYDLKKFDPFYTVEMAPLFGIALGSALRRMGE
ncbi:type IV pilus assembly protein PilM [Candidatus Aminicenantes bacterium AC-708-M15]|nr:type IV pilus assembly protein PilM [SCandidatus Aminicenantes bacterium Aminicenantia_JdfR_composite]MCP2596351.1 type IV pilus assembly protein PilM [Candidatus Aminicenantes bacterium AC-335-G13]MCP2598516.1 type IV pilus assembly protein PilM [Candidatus Aminicenantes bacterium AC-335-L06]MCP2599019.1 type IV pilus assembly protein PilM [Candidatus Aminicenantes bacterium AC-335-B20]MCP2604119.1 type IV pilus assembly protein PilM [Candidatus Aminicenantes bacterium AC-708-M15]MCP260540